MGSARVFLTLAIGANFISMCVYLSATAGYLAVDADCDKCFLV
jgi:hypothetical protein